MVRMPYTRSLQFFSIQHSCSRNVVPLFTDFLFGQVCGFKSLETHSPLPFPHFFYFFLILPIPCNEHALTSFLIPNQSGRVCERGLRHQPLLQNGFHPQLQRLIRPGGAPPPYDNTLVTTNH